MKKIIGLILIVCVSYILAQETQDGQGTATFSSIVVSDSITVGGITIQSPPSFRAVKSSTQSITSSVDTTLSWEVESWDIDSWFSLTDNAAQPKLAGKYFFNVSSEIIGLDTGAVYQVVINTNGVTAGRSRTYSAGLAQRIGAQASVILNLTTGDVVSASVYHLDSTSRLVGGDEERTYFEGYWIGE